MKVAVILNPTAGQGKPGASMEKIEHSLNRQGINCELFLTESPGDGEHLARAAAEKEYDLIIAAGGDGTVNEVVNGLVGTGAKLGILPVGSVNVLARELRIPLDLQGAVKNLVEGTAKLIDLGRANDRYFSLMAGFGFDAEVVANVIKPIKEMIGTSAYVLSGLETLATYKATDIVLEMSNQIYSMPAYMVIVCNVATYAYSLKIAPTAIPDDGIFDVCVFGRPITDKLGFIHLVADIFMKRHLDHDEVKLFRTNNVTIKSSPAAMVQIDGESFGCTPVSISVVPKALPIIVPR